VAKSVAVSGAPQREQNLPWAGFPHSEQNIARSPLLKQAVGFLIDCLLATRFFIGTVG
jgi:hypothetical protein